MRRCAVCGRRIAAMDLLGKWWVFVHVAEDDTAAMPGRLRDINHFAVPHRRG